MKLQRQQPNKPARDPRLDKPVLGWDMQPTQLFGICAAFVIIVIIMHFMGSMFRGN